MHTKFVLLDVLSEWTSRSKLRDYSCLGSNFPDNLLNRVVAKFSLLLISNSLPDLVLYLIKLLVDILDRLRVIFFFLRFFSKKLLEFSISHFKRSDR